MLARRLTACALLILTFLAVSSVRVSAQQPPKSSQKASSSETGSIYVTNNFDGTISVISLANYHVTRTIRVLASDFSQISPSIHLGHISDSTHNMSFSSNGDALNVVINGFQRDQNTPGQGSPAVIKISTATNTIKTTVSDLATVIKTFWMPVPIRAPYGIASDAVRSPDGTKLYVTDIFNEYHSKDGEKENNMNVLWEIPTPKNSPGIVKGAIKNGPNSQSNGKMAPISNGNGHLPIPKNFNVIPVGHHPEAIAISPDGTKVYVSNGGDETLSVVDTIKNSVIATVPVGAQPKGLAISPDGSMVYVVNHGNITNNFKGTVSVISTATNKVIHTIPVGRGPVGIVVSGKPPAPAQTDNICIRTDANRNGTITFDDTDKATSTKPYTFWLNDNRDVLANGEWEDDDPARINLKDFLLPYVESPRDFEDFERLQIKVPQDFNAIDGKWKITVQFTDVGAGEPVINVVPAKDASLSYLTESYNNSAKAYGLPPINPSDSYSSLHTPSIHKIPLVLPEIIPVSKHKIGPISKAEEIALPLSQVNIADNVVPLLFEGVGKGKGALTVRLYKSGTEVGKDHIYLNLLPITQMYDHYTVDPSENGIAQEDSSGSNNVTINQIKVLTQAFLKGKPKLVNEDETTHDSQNHDYILFVHGWRMQKWERIAFAQTAFKRLWHLGYKGRFGLFSWATEYTTTDLPTIAYNHANYDDSEWKAYTSAQALHSLLTTLSQKFSVRVFAHSMGNVVTSEALRLETKSNSPQKLVQTYVATQAAVAAQAYDADAPNDPNPKIPRISHTPNLYSQYPSSGILGGEPYFKHIDEAATKLVNFYNPADYALGNWLLDQETKPDGPTSTGSYDYSPRIKSFEKYQFSNTGSGKQFEVPLRECIERITIFRN